MSTPDPFDFSEPTFAEISAELDALHETLRGPRTERDAEFDRIVNQLRLDSPEGSWRGGVEL